MEKRFRALLTGIAAGLLINVVFSVADYLLRVRRICEALPVSPVGTNCQRSVFSYMISALNPFTGVLFWVSILLGLLGAYVYYRG